MGLRIFLYTVCIQVFIVLTASGAVKTRPQSVWGCYSLLAAQSSGPLMQHGQFDPKEELQMDQVHHNIQMGQFDLVIGQMEGRAAHEWLLQLIERELRKSSGKAADVALVDQILQQIVQADLPPIEMSLLTEGQKSQLTFWLAIFRVLPRSIVESLLNHISSLEHKSLSGMSVQHQTTWLFLLRSAQ